MHDRDDEETMGCQVLVGFNLDVTGLVWNAPVGTVCQTGKCIIPC